MELDVTMKPGVSWPRMTLKFTTASSARLCSLSSRLKPPGLLLWALVISQNNWDDLSSSQFSLIFKNKIGFYSWRMSINQASSYKNVWKQHLNRDRNERLGQVILVPSVLRPLQAVALTGAVSVCGLSVTPRLGSGSAFTAHLLYWAECRVNGGHFLIYSVDKETEVREARKSQSSKTWPRLVW